MAGPVCPVCKNGVSSEMTGVEIDGRMYHTGCAARVKAINPRRGEQLHPTLGHPGIMQPEDLGHEHAETLDKCRNPVCKLQRDMNRALALLDQATSSEVDPHHSQDDWNKDAQTLLLKHRWFEHAEAAHDLTSEALGGD